MFSFQNPAAFLLLLLLPALFILRKLKIFTQITYPAVLADWDGSSFIWKARFRKFFSILAKILVIAGFCSAVFAFADPIVTEQEKVYTSLGTDVIFVVDTSPSMAARDIDGITRLEAAKKAISELISSNDGYRYGIVALGSEASVIVPPTNDISIFAERMNEIQVGILGNGSAIGDGLSTAVCHLASSSAPKKCIVLFTDGENNAGEIHPQTAAKLALDNEITLYVVGVGSKGTVPIEYKDPVSGKQYSGYLNSDYNSSSLKQIASTGKGRFFESRTLDELSTALSIIAKNEVVVQNYTYKNVTSSLYKKFLLVSLILIIIAWFIKYVGLQEKTNFHYKKILILRDSLVLFSFIMIICAYQGFSWGTYLAPVQKCGTSVSFVFDISNSMMARDTETGKTRLESASIYARKLLSKMEDTTVSVVLAKGEGIAAIPLTQDSVMIESLLEAISPNLMTAPGTSLGKGILCAKNSFPANYATAGRIWVFTDGEETDGELTDAFTECIRSGIPVTIVGFGSEKETPVLAGDGKTKVNTALRSDLIKQSINTAGKNLGFYKNQTPVTFVNATDKGSAFVLLNQLQNKLSETQIISYEAKPIPRFKLFLIFAILAFAFSYIFTEFDWRKIFKNKKEKKNKKAGKTAAGLMIFCSVFTLSGCSSQSGNILKGSYAFYQKQYRRSIAYFKEAVEKINSEKNPESMNYALYDLGTAYSFINENEAACKMYEKISPEASDKIKYAAYYNAGIIAHKNADYENAQTYFRKALEIDNTKLEAKINLELSIQQAEAEARQNQADAIPASEENSDLPDIEKGIFKHIKENDKKQWKNSESKEPLNLENDY